MIIVISVTYLELLTNITYTNILVKHTHFVFFILYNTLVNL
jgi:hypothetical protein